MIVIGYQGIGKSSVAEKSRGFIDLESSNFYYAGNRPTNWHVYYCKIAEALSKQGYVVFTSSHEPVRSWFVKSNERTIIICPRLELKNEWIGRLDQRYRSTLKEKDFRAWQNAACRYDENIRELCDCGIPVLAISTMAYDLEEMIRTVINNNLDIDFHCRQIF